MEYVKVNGTEYPASIAGLTTDLIWDNRQSKEITFVNNAMSYSQANENFTEGVSWSIISVWNETIVDEETGEETIIEHRDEFDNSDYNMAGPITDMRDGGTLKVKMGKPTELESLIEDFFGGDM